VRLPQALLPYTDGRTEAIVAGGNVDELLAALDRSFPGLRDRIVDETGRPRRFVNIFINEDRVEVPLGEAAVVPGDVVHILPNIAGGGNG
jgi:molybdopterin converting factor small subunit